MSEAPRLLSDVEFAKLTTEEKYNYLNEIVNYLLSDRAKRAEEAPASPPEVSPAKPETKQPPAPPEE